MPFNSYEFIFAFLPVTVLGFWVLHQVRGRGAALVWLLLASAVFYAYASPEGLLTILPSILLDYAIARALLQLGASRLRLRRVLVFVGVAANVAFLGYFKYRNFFLDSLNTALATHFEIVRVLLPLGISFLVFQKLAFLADVYVGEVKSVRLREFLLFTLFFPRVIAGPIVHYREVMPQLTSAPEERWKVNVAVGICLFSIGLFKKTFIADTLAQYVAPGFDTQGGSPGLVLAWMALFSYALQLYFDFSGYSDMALGVARMVGVRLPMNFNSPYKAASIIEFWNRWHITLTRFLTEYIYTPLVLRISRSRLAAGKSVIRGRRSTGSAIAALVAVPTLVTMAISGLWHGAGWQFIVWGLLHGVYLTINQIWRLLRPKSFAESDHYDRIMQPAGRALTFGAVLLALVFFRSQSLSSATSFLANLSGLHGPYPHIVELIERSGVALPFSILSMALSLKVFGWIVLLLIAVNCLPNSLELLRRFEPALDFPTEGADKAAVEVTDAARSWWSRIGHAGEHGLDLSVITATVLATLCVLGALALDQNKGFVYGGF